MKYKITEVIQSYNAKKRCVLVPMDYVGLISD